MFILDNAQLLSFFLFHKNQVAIIFLCAVRDCTPWYSEGSKITRISTAGRNSQSCLGETGVLTSLGAAGSLLPKHPCQEVLFLDESTKALLFIFFPPHFWLQKIYWLPRQLVQLPTEIALKCDKSNISFTKTRL